MAFKGKVALVTGGASGMGQLDALRLAKQGAKVAIMDLNDKGLQETAAQSPNIKPYRCDVSNLEEVRQVVAQIEQDLGPIDRLTHCAAIMPGQSIKDMPAELINKVMAINSALTVPPRLRSTPSPKPWCARISRARSASCWSARRWSIPHWSTRPPSMARKASRIRPSPEKIWRNLKKSLMLSKPPSNVATG